MTTREFLNSIATNENLPTDVREYAQDGIEKLNAKNAKRASTPSKTAIANEPIKAKIVEYLTANKVATASDISVALEISTQKASALARQLTESGVLTVNDVKVPKKGTVKAYAIMEKVGE